MLLRCDNSQEYFARSFWPGKTAAPKAHRPRGAGAGGQKSAHRPKEGAQAKEGAQDIKETRKPEAEASTG